MSQHGYTPYRPQGNSKLIIQAAKAVLIDYKAWERPMTVRQVFYRLVAEYNYSKTEKAYGSLINYIARSRRAYEREIISHLYAGKDIEVATEIAIHDRILIPFNWIRDDKGQSYKEKNFVDGNGFMDDVREKAEQMKLDRMIGQPQQVELWCEAAGMVNLLYEIADPYGIRVSSGGGYDSVTAKHKLARRAMKEWNENNRHTLVLHVGDFDPSGEGMYETLHGDVMAMVSDYGYYDSFEVQRIALTERQVIDMEIITAPPKPADTRKRNFVAKHPEIRQHLGTDDITAQLEALTPAQIEELIRNKINDVIDQDAYQERLREERDTRDRLMEKLEEI